MVTTAALWHLIKSSDLFTKAIVYILFIVTISVFILSFYGIILLVNKTKTLKISFKAIKKNEQNLLNILKESCSDFVFFIDEFLKKDNIKNKEYSKEILFHLSYYYVQKEQRIISFLAAASAASPLVGLLGTVWGIIHAFMGMTLAGGGDLAAIAPGIAEALITTLSGLLVAIPSLLFYHLLSRLKQQYLYYSDIVIIHFLEYHNIRNESSNETKI